MTGALAVGHMHGGNVDIAEPPRIALESPESCRDPGHAEQLLRQSLGPARAPGSAWIVAITIEPTKTRMLRAEADITDDGGAHVAYRALSDARGDCEGLARAVGVWASLVLEAERERLRPAQADPSPGDTPVEAPRTRAARSGDDVETPSPIPRRPLVAPDDNGASRDGSRGFEVGLSAFAMTGPDGIPILGVSPSGVIDVTHDFFVRPAFFVGAASTADPTTHLYSTWAAGRLDACSRVVASKTGRHAFEFDACGGGEGGVTRYAGENIAHVSFGPSFDLRDELGNDLALTLRGVAGINAGSGEPLGLARGEFGISCRFW